MNRGNENRVGSPEEPSGHAAAARPGPNDGCAGADGPFIHRIKPQLVDGDSITPNNAVSASIHTPSLQTIGAQAIARLQKRQSHSSVSSQGQYTRHTPSTTSRTVAGCLRRINQNRLRAGHAQRSGRIVRQKRRRSSRPIAIENYSQEYRLLVGIASHFNKSSR